MTTAAAPRADAPAPAPIQIPSATSLNNRASITWNVQAHLRAGPVAASRPVGQPRCRPATLRPLAAIAAFSSACHALAAPAPCTEDGVAPELQGLAASQLDLVGRCRARTYAALLLTHPAASPHLPFLSTSPPLHSLSVQCTSPAWVAACCSSCQHPAALTARPLLPPRACRPSGQSTPACWRRWRARRPSCHPPPQRARCAASARSCPLH